MRQAHLTRLTQSMGIDGLALCGDEADISFFDEYNFEGLMNMPWYDQLKGNEMRSLFKTKKPDWRPHKNVS